MVVGVVAVAAAAGGVWLLLRAPHETAPPAADLLVQGDAVRLSRGAPQWRYIELAKATTTSPLAPVPAPARITVDEARAVPIFAPLPGRVERVEVQLGQDVKPGDRLVAIRSSALPEIGREVETTRAALAVKRTLLERTRELVKLRAVAEKDLLLAEQERTEAELALKAAEGKRRSLRLGPLDASGLYWVTASRAGTVVERRALIGMEVGPDRSDPLLSLAELAEVVVVADVLEHDAAGLQAGSRASVSDLALGGATADGKVEYVAQMVDPVRRTVAVRVRVANPARKLRPNSFAQVTFAPTGGSRVVVPADAVVTDDQRSVVFVEVAGEPGGARLERRPVQVGRARDGKVEILDGLRPGETFVARGALLLLNALDLAGG